MHLCHNVFEQPLNICAHKMNENGFSLMNTQGAIYLPDAVFPTTEHDAEWLQSKLFQQLGILVAGTTQRRPKSLLS